MVQSVPGDFFDTNMELLRQKDADLYQRLLLGKDEAIGEIVLAANGKPNLRVSGPQGECFIHDCLDPEREARNVVSKVAMEEADVVILMGMGLGYTPSLLLQQRPSLFNLLIFEPDHKIFLQAMRVMDLTSLLTDPRVLITIGTAEDRNRIFEKAQNGLMTENIYMSRQMSSFLTNPKAYEELADHVIKVAHEFCARGGTLSRHGVDQFENRLNSLTRMHHGDLLEDLQNKFTGIPAILVAGGPSLDKNMATLARVGDKAVIICVDTALPALLAKNIQPHFVTSVDYRRVMYEKIAPGAAYPQAANISLICMSWVTSKIPKFFPAKHIFWSFAGGTMESVISKALGGELMIGSAESVAHLSLLSAITMGCSPIVFIGQDLVISSRKNHVENAVIGQSDYVARLLKEGKELVWVEGNDGEKLPAKRQYLSYKVALERIMAAHPGHYINATEGGARLDGTEFMPLETVAQKYLKEQYAISTVTDASSTKDHAARKSAGLVRALQTILKTAGRQRQSVATAIKLTGAIHKSLLHLKGSGSVQTFADFPSQLQKKIRRLDQLNDTIDRDREFWGLMEELSVTGLREIERKKLELAALTKKPGHYIAWMQGNLSMFDLINGIRIDNLDKLEKHLAAIIDFHCREQEILQSLAKDENGDALSSLARMYYETENFALLHRLLGKMPADVESTAELAFYRGVIAANYMDHETARQYFDLAAADASYAEKIAAFRLQLGDEYLLYASNSEKFTIRTKRHFIVKGLRFCPFHAQLRRFLRDLFDSSLAQISEKMRNNAGEAVKTDIAGWENMLQEFSESASCLDSRSLGQFYTYAGDLEAAQAHFTEAIAKYKKAMLLDRHKPGTYLRLTDLYFAVNDFERGIANLQQAVALDRNFARYWENIGDNLHSCGKPADAVAAYEQCYVVLPERIGLLRKIGDCFRQSGDDQAALEAYRQYKLKLEQQPSENTVAVNSWQEEKGEVFSSSLLSPV